jgi:hypothetical protein
MSWKEITIRCVGTKANATRVLLGRHVNRDGGASKEVGPARATQAGFMEPSLIDGKFVLDQATQCAVTI